MGVFFAKAPRQRKVKRSNLHTECKEALPLLPPRYDFPIRQCKFNHGSGTLFQVNHGKFIVVADGQIAVVTDIPGRNLSLSVQ